MNKKELRERCAAAADQIETMLSELRARGLSEASAVQLVAGMLASSSVYIPFTGIVGEAADRSYH